MAVVGALTGVTAQAAVLAVLAMTLLALVNVQPGDGIRLAANTACIGSFVVARSGTSARRIQMNGSRYADVLGFSGGRTLKRAIKGGRQGLFTLGTDNIAGQELGKTGRHKAVRVQGRVRDREVSAGFAEHEVLSDSRVETRFSAGVTDSGADFSATAKSGRQLVLTA
ncbi:hypothetical protein [Actinocrispum sp. NPDC049592]|uniref:hypothetical protein n=1 Tax=Actinocrispum sp. NPDC049592 TaxID=3154835 RepID=UPI00341F6ADA